MAELDLHYDPAWLQQRPDSNQPMSLAEAFQLRQRQQQIDTEKALLPLRKQEMQARVANAALDMKIQQDKMALALKIKANDAAGWSRASQVNNWLDPAQVNPIYAEGAKEGGYSPSFATFIENMQQNAQTTNARVKEAEARLRMENRPPAAVQTVLEADKMESQALTAEASDDPVTARRLRNNAEILRGSVRGAQPPTDTAAVKNAAELLKADKAALTTSGAAPFTPAEEAAKYREYLALQTAKPNEETIIEATPDGRTTVTTRRGGKAGATVAAETKAQMDLMRFQASIQQLELMDSQLRPEDVGFAGKIGDLNIKWLGQFTGQGDTALTQNRAQAKGALTAFLDTQVTRGRLRKEEADEYKELFFDPAALGQSYKQTKAAAQQMKKLVRMESITTAKSAGQPLKPWMFLGLDLESDFKSLRRSGTLTPDEVLQWYKAINQPVQ